MISVVIPVYNRAHLVERTLASIDAQTLAPDRIVLVDNNSNDNTLEVLQRYAATRPNVVVVSEPRAGAAEARNCGLAQVQSDYVLFFDSDDEMPRRHIEELDAGLKAACLPDIGIFGKQVHHLNGSIKNYPVRKGDLMFNHVFHSTLSTQCYVVKTQFLRNCGGWIENMPVWNDYVLGVRLLKANPTVMEMHISEPVKVNAVAESITGTGFSNKAGQWERALNCCEQLLHGTAYASLIRWRRAILAGMYMREKHPELAQGLAQGALMWLTARYVALGGRGVAEFAKIL